MDSDMETTFEDKSIVVKISDPWDLGEKLNWKPLIAVIFAVDNSVTPERIILRLADPFEYKNVRCEYFVASPRYEDAQINDLLGNKGVYCGLTRVPEERLSSEDPFDLEWWRGGPALIAELVFATGP